MSEREPDVGDARDDQRTRGDWDRRTVLQLLGAGATTSAVGLGVLPSQAAAVAIGTGPPRLDEAYELRCELADEYVGDATWPGHPDNGDEGLYNDKRGNYIKGLELANSLGEVDLAAYQSLLNALSSGNPADFASIGVGGDRQLVSPQTAHRFRMVGLDPHQGTMPAAPEFASDEMAGEMAEVYWHALVRDVPFVDYPTYSGTHTPSDAVQELNGFPVFTGPKQGGNVTLGTLFRMDVPGCLQGPYVSQLLWQPIPAGAFEHAQRINEAAPVDYNTGYSKWLRVISGDLERGGEFPPTSTTQKTGNQRYIRNGRDLGEYVHVNFSYQPYLNAALVLFFGLGAPLDPNVPHTNTGTQDPYVTFGGFSLTEVVAAMAGAAASTAWFQKWLVHRRLRPETYAGRIHNQFQGNKNYGLPSYLVQSNAVARIVHFNANNYGHRTALLPVAYKEGSPAHPSYPSAHAVIAGACVTALKAFFDESTTITNAVRSNAAGTQLNSIGFQPTVGEELNKLAANVTIGRNFAGVHYRSDGLAGMRLGEQAAHNALEYMLAGANEGQIELEYEDFDGNARQLY